MICQRCGEELPEGARYCCRCGFSHHGDSGTEFVKLRRSDFCALILSMMIPGMGHVYLDQTKRGWAMVGCYILLALLFLLTVLKDGASIDAGGVTITMAGFQVIFPVLMVILWIYALVDTKRELDRYNGSL